MRRSYEPIDAAGRRLRRGDVVRVVGVPDLSSLPEKDELNTRAVFAHLVGSYKRISGFDEFGHAHLEFRIRGGKLAGLHSVWVEPFLLRKPLSPRVGSRVSRKRGRKAGARG